MSWRLLGGLALLLLMAYPLALVRMSLAAFAGWLLELVDATRALDHLVSALPVDPVYGSIATKMLAGLDIRGLAIAGPIGEWLHQVSPFAFASPAVLRRGDWLDAVVAPGGPMPARFFVLLVADVALLAFGQLVAPGRFGRVVPGDWRSVTRWLALIVQGAAIGSLLALVVLPPDYEQLGLAPVINKLFGASSNAEYEAIAAFARPVVRIAIPAGAIAAGLLIAAAVRRIGSLVVGGWRVAFQRQRIGMAPAWGTVAVVGALAVVQAGLLCSGAVNRGRIVSDRVVLRTIRPDATVAAATGPAGTPSPTPAQAPASTSASAKTAPQGVAPAVATSAELAKVRRTRTAPSVVRIEGSSYNYQLVVNGEPRVVKGLGYNPQYAALGDEKRRELYDRDFASIRASGIELIQGWDMAEFDQLLIDRAHAAGLGVVMPFDLTVDGKYADPGYQQEVMARVEQWVKQYKNHPGLWMWGLGNEVLHGIKHRQRAREFAAFYVALADYVHELDPNHPVFYRDAEDVFVAPIRDVFQADGKPRRWFVYGINIFTDRIEPVVANWEQIGFDVPIVLSEFGPMGYPAPDRPDGYRWMWSVIRGKSNYVLGGLVYVWFTNGSDPLDPMFGLVDGDDLAVDGALAAVKSMYEATPSRGATVR